MKTLRLILAGIGGATVTLVAAMISRYYLGRRRADKAWEASNYAPLTNLGEVDKLTILPLIDFYAARPDLATEPGVSYLVRAGDTTILFDVGYNVRGEHPSPLLRNMEALGVGLDEIDAIVISHAHGDHMGGMENQVNHTFSLSARPVELGDIPAYVPVPLIAPQFDVRVVGPPQVIAPGVATLGTIPRQLFFFGYTLEQAIAVNVRGRGAVLIIGCGHPGIERIIARAEAVLPAPIYGLVGGLHYPVAASREMIGPIQAQKLFGTGRPPWQPITERDVLEAIELLQGRKIGLISVSPHDSCDWTLNTFREAFGPAYRDLRVGEPIEVSAP